MAELFEIEEVASTAMGCHWQPIASLVGIYEGTFVLRNKIESLGTGIDLT